MSDEDLLMLIDRGAQAAALRLTTASPLPGLGAWPGIPRDESTAGIELSSNIRETRAMA
jgi:hypothetical protein